MAFTESASSQLLNQLTGRTSSGILSNCYMGLSSTAPNVNGTNFTEPSAGSGYARATIGMSSASTSCVMNSPENGSTTNKDIIFFPEAEQQWSTLTHFGLFSAKTGGQLMIYGALATPISVSANYVPIFRVGNFTMTLT